MNRTESLFAANISRRQALQLKAIGLGLAGLAQTGLVSSCATASVAIEGGAASLKALTEKEYAILRAMADVIMPATEGIPAASALGVLAKIDHELSLWSEARLSQIKDALWAFEHWPLFKLRFTRFTAMSAEDKANYLRDWAESSWDFQRAVFIGIKTVVVFFTYSNERSWAAINYYGPWKEQMPVAPTPVDFGREV